MEVTKKQTHIGSPVDFSILGLAYGFLSHTNSFFIESIKIQRQDFQKFKRFELILLHCELFHELTLKNKGKRIDLNKNTGTTVN